MPSYTYVAARYVIESWTAAHSATVGYAAVSSNSAIEAWDYDSISTADASDGFIIVPVDNPPAGRWVRLSDYDATVALFQKPIAGSQLEPGTVTTDQMSSDIANAVQQAIQITEVARDLQNRVLDQVNDLASLATSISQGLLGNEQDKHEIRQTLSSQVGDARAYADTIVFAATGPGSAIAGQLSTFSAALDGKASVTVTDILASRVTATETGIDSLGGRTTIIENTLPGKASTTVTDGLTSRITVAEGNITSLAGRVTSVENTIPGLATTTITDSLASRITSAESGITSLAGRTTTIENALPGKASTSVTDTLTSQVSTLNGTVSGYSASITSLQSLVGNNSSNAILQLYSGSTPSDATSRFVVSLSQNSSSTAHAAAFYMDATSSGSRLVGAADLVAFYASKFQILKPDGSAGFSFDPTSGLITTNGIALNALTDGAAYDVLEAAGTSSWDFGDLGGSALNPTYSFTINGQHLQAFLPSGTSLSTGVLTNGYDCLVFFFGTWKSSTAAVTNMEAFIRAADFTGVTTNYAPQRLSMNNTDIGQSFGVVARVPAAQTRFWPVVHAENHNIYVTSAYMAYIRLKR